MKRDERHVEKFLVHRGHLDIVHEPDGGVPPDFLIDGHIAIEVRGLNQNFFGTGHTRGLEETSIPLMQKIEKLLLSFGKTANGQSWFVCFDFRRPLEPWSKLKFKLRKILQAFISSPTSSETQYALGSGFSVELYQASSAHSTFYLLGAYTDDDSGGWLISEIAQNLEYCINEKSAKRDRNSISTYSEWWLVLVDRIGYGLDQDDQRQLTGC
jgi:hypothetical protein